ncbi:MAG: hypothetical protein VXW32_15220 [Myxococcota bacterium]|nr:hypothetical protein [Myxococcota bacterium]
MILTIYLLTGCGPGTLEFDNEIRELRSAWVLKKRDAEEHVLLLSTSHLPCTVDTPKSPTEVLLETQEISHARSREGSLLLWTRLTSPMTDGTHSVTLSGYQVLEAERMWTDGLIANYRPTETEEYLIQADLTLRSTSDIRWTGQLLAAKPAVEATFRADVCESEEVFQILGLIGID